MIKFCGKKKKIQNKKSPFVDFVCFQRERIKIIFHLICFYYCLFFFKLLHAINSRKNVFWKRRLLNKASHMEIIFNADHEHQYKINSTSSYYPKTENYWALVKIVNYSNKKNTKKWPYRICNCKRPSPWKQVFFLLQGIISFLFLYNTVNNPIHTSLLWTFLQT